MVVETHVHLVLEELPAGECPDRPGTALPQSYLGELLAEGAGASGEQDHFVCEHVALL